MSNIKSDIKYAFSNKKIQPAKKGGIYIARENAKSIIIVNLSYDELMKSEYVDKFEIDSAVERRNVILVKLKSLHAVTYGERVETVEIKAPSGIKIKTEVIETLRIVKDLVTSKEIERKVVDRKYKEVDLGFSESEKSELIKKLDEEIESLEAELSRITSSLATMRERKVLVHRGCGGILEYERSWTRPKTSIFDSEYGFTLYRCNKCGKIFKVTFGSSTEFDPDEGWRSFPWSRLPDDVEEVSRIDVDEEYRKKYEMLKREAEEIEKKIDGLWKQKMRLSKEAYDEEEKRARIIAGELGIKVVSEDNEKVVFNDGTVFHKGDITTEPYFSASELFRAVKDAERIWLSLMGG